MAEPMPQREAVVVFLHGHDDDPAAYRAATEAMLPSDRWSVVRLRAPIPTEGTRSTWFTDGADGPVPSEVRSAIEVVDHQVRLAAGDDGIERDLVVGGFSQGAALALAWALEATEQPRLPVVGVFAVAGWLLDSDGLRLDPGRATDRPILFGHGTDDDVVPLPLGRAAARVVHRNDAVVALVQHDVAHELDPFVDDIREWLGSLDEGAPLHHPPT